MAIEPKMSCIMTKEEKMAVIMSLKPRDFFNIAQRPSGNKVWNEQNRWETRQVVAFVDRGWPRGVELFSKTLWYEFDMTNEYPFYSSAGSVGIEYMAENAEIIEKIDDPETQGVKHRKPYVAEKIKQSIRDAVSGIQMMGRQAAVMIKKRQGQTSQEALACYGMYMRIVKKLWTYDREYGKARQVVPMVGEYKHLVRSFEDAPYEKMQVPYVSFRHDGQEITMSPAAVDMSKWKLIFVMPDGSQKEISVNEVRPNSHLLPIDFGFDHPWESQAKVYEAEDFARRVVMQMGGDWGALEQAMKIVNEQYGFYGRFDHVADYLGSAEACARFSKTWNEIKNNFDNERSRNSL